MITRSDSSATGCPFLSAGRLISEPVTETDFCWLFDFATWWQAGHGAGFGLAFFYVSAQAESLPDPQQDKPP
jgi:hypothetical protein